MTARLEAVYRRLLTCYPPRWRQEHEDEIVATLLDVADAGGRTRPSAGEVANLVAHGLAARLGASRGLVPAVVRHRVAVLALASVATLSLSLFVVAEVLPVPRPVLGGYGPYRSGLTFGPFVTLGAALYPLPVLAFAAAVAGARRTSRALLGLTFLAVCAALPAAAWSDAERPMLYLLVTLGLLAGMAAVGMPPAVPRRDLFAATALIGLLLAGAAVYGVVYYRQPYPGAGWNLPLVAYRGPYGLLAAVGSIVPAAVVVGAAVATAASVRRPGWIVATFVVGGSWSVIPVAASIRYPRWGWGYDNYSILGFVFVFGLIALAAAVDLFRAADLRIVRNPGLSSTGRDATEPK